MRSRPNCLSDQNFQIESICDQTFQTEMVPDQIFQTQVTSSQTFQTERVSDQTFQTMVRRQIQTIAQTLIRLRLDSSAFEIVWSEKNFTYEQIF